MSIWSVDYVDPLGFNVARRAKLIVLEDIDAVIATVIKGRSMTMRHTSWTQRVCLDWLLERLREDWSMCLRYVKTKDQTADILTKASFAGPRWDHFISLCSFHPEFRRVKSPQGPASKVAAVVCLDETAPVVKGVGVPESDPIVDCSLENKYPESSRS